ncbi:MAG: hypothetical protein JWQ74_1087 [Marmoricola sp.]|nr:hypothetical protein [Marmoricola sp.]
MTRSFRSRLLAPVALVAASALVLTGCGGGDDKPTDKPAKAAALGSCDYQSGAASDAVKVTGTFGQKVTPTFTKPLTTTSLRRTVLTKGTGAVTKKGDNVSASISLFNGKDGKQVNVVRTPVAIGDASLPAWVDAGVSCVPIGSRVVTTALGKDVLGGSADTDTIKATDTIVIVTDVVVATVKATADSIKPGRTTALPKVTFGKSGKPTLAKLTGTPPADYQLQILRKGTGAKVKAGDTVTVNYQGTSWDSNQVFDSSWDKGRAPASFRTDQVVPGFGAALIGQKAGTRLIVTIPPKYGYGDGIIVKTDDGKISSDELVGQTMVFVVDIQSTKATPAGAQ